IIKFLTKRFGLDPLPGVRSGAGDLTSIGHGEGCFEFEDLSHAVTSSMSNDWTGATVCSSEPNITTERTSIAMASVSSAAGGAELAGG
ncbi:MAG: hypothetical protein K2X97_15895, partial [Mycobacteriaceae bacterium]|nr:hypothetical protein [Mycobacteriaceae bacterium]